MSTMRGAAPGGPGEKPGPYEIAGAPIVAAGRRAGKGWMPFAVVGPWLDPKVNVEPVSELKPLSYEMEFILEYASAAESMALLFGMPLVEASILLEPHLVRGVE